MAQPLVGIFMGSSYDWETMHLADESLQALGVELEV
jgi:phosphoribosylcarboxyaminoimidazole (NCAIR) mutase